MSAYTTQARIQAAIPAPILVDACDDDGDGSADSGVLDEVIAAASNAVDGLLAGRFSVPFAGDPGPTVREASFVFACELVYDRRELTDTKNPFKSRADAMRTLLSKIAAGDQPLDASKPVAFTPGAAVTEDTTLNSSLR